MGSEACAAAAMIKHHDWPQLSGSWAERTNTPTTPALRPSPSLSHWTDLRGRAQAAGLLAGSHHQQVSALVALVVQRPGQTDLPRLLPDAEQTAGIDQQAVADWLRLEGNGEHHQEAEAQRESDFQNNETPSLPFDSNCARVELKSKSSFPSSALHCNEINYYMAHWLRPMNTFNQYLPALCNNVILLCRYQCLFSGLCSVMACDDDMSICARVPGVTKPIFTNIQTTLR